MQRIRAAHFRRYPLCAHCERRGRITPATELDHIVALDKGGADFDRDRGANRQGLCEACHKVKTAADLGHRPRVAVGIDGFPAARGDDE